MTVKGKAAHSGLDPERGVSAILELSYVIQQLFALNDPAQGVTVNVGTIDGGLRPNVVAPSSRAVLDVRVPSPEAAARIDAAIKALRPRAEGITLVVEGAWDGHRSSGPPAIGPYGSRRDASASRCRFA